MNKELVLHTNPMSRGRIVRWMLEEIGVPYRTEFIEYGPAMKTEEYLSLNPMGKVPTLVYGSAPEYTGSTSKSHKKKRNRYILCGAKSPKGLINTHSRK